MNRPAPLRAMPMRAALAVALALLALAAAHRVGWTQRLASGAIAGAATEAPADSSITFRHLGVEDGLASDDVTAVLQDRLGFVWVGVLDGLYRYDGYALVPYRHDDDDPGSLCGNGVSSLAEDADGGLWVGTFGGGVCRYDPATDTFAPRAGVPEGDVFALLAARDGAVWAGTSGGLVRFEAEADSGALVAALGAREVSALAQSADGAIWAGLPGALARLDGAGRLTATHALDDAPQIPVSALRPRRGGLWVGTLGGGLFTFDAAAARFTAVPMGGELGTQGVSSVLEDAGGALWVGTFGGGLRRRAPDGRLTAFRARPGRAGIPDDMVSALLLDRQGVLWVGTYGGLERTDLARGRSTPFRHSPTDPTSLASDGVLAVLEAADGALYVGTERGLDRQAPGATAFDHLAFPGGSAPQVRALAQTADGAIWAGATSGLHRLPPGRAGGPLEAVGPTPLLVVSLLADPGGALWVGTVGRGLARLDRGADSLAFLPLPPGLDALGADNVQALARTPDGALWAGTRGGLLRLDPRTGRLARVALGDDGTEGGVLALHADGNALWAGTREGLVRRDLRTGETTRYTEATSRLPSNTVQAIVADDDGRLWLSTARGLARFEPRTETFRVYDADPALQPGTLGRAAATGPSGHVYVGGTAGLRRFRPDQLSAANPFPPQVAVTAVRVDNEALAPSLDGPLRDPAPVAEVLALPHDARFVTFEYAGLHFSAPERTRYAVRLDGFDPGWMDVGTQRAATYTNLDPGTYTFEVRATTADGVPSDAPARLRVVVRPPWWRTGWAYLGYVLLIGAALVGADRVQRRRVRRQEREAMARREAELRAEQAEAQARALRTEAAQKAALEEAYAALQAQQAELEAKRAELEEKTDALERALAEQRAMQAQLVQSEKLASLGQLTAGIAHEIKNPLNFVNNFASLSVDLADELGDALLAAPARPLDAVLLDVQELLADLRENAQRIHEHGRRADRIVQAMLQHSRGGAGERVEVDVNRFVEEYANLAWHGARANEPDFNITLERDFDPEAGTAALVPQEVGRVLINLLGNAFYAAQKRRTAEGEAFTPTVTVRTRRRRGAVEIAVADNGVGMSEAVRRRIFEPFFTTKPTGEGTGLGLSLSYEIVTQGHGGALTVESEAGAGSTFTVHLPARATRSPEATAPEAAEPSEATETDGA